MSDPADRVLRTAVVAEADSMLRALADWVSVPSVSAEPAHAVDVTRSARWLCAALRQEGFPIVEEWETDGLPAVYGCRPAADPAAPTLLVYSHHDVHAAEEEEWRETAPFTPALREGRLYGRGASDAKGQILCHLWALRAHLAARTSSGAGAGVGVGADSDSDPGSGWGSGSGPHPGTAPAVTLKLLIEGEEEIGSVHLGDLLAEHAEELSADVAMVSDTMLWSLDDAAVCTAVRGSVNARLEIRGAHRGLHSGAASGAAPNALNELCRILGRLHDDDGRISLPGFYDAVREPSPAERAELDALPPFDTAAWTAETGTFGTTGEDGRSVRERVWFRPSAEISSLAGGDPQGPVRGLIPAAASAELLLRLVPDQRADDVAAQLRAWLDHHIRPCFSHDLQVSSTISDPYTTPSGHPALEALRRSMSRAFGGPARRMANGGAAPAAQLARSLDAPVLFFRTGLIDDRWHGPDEKVEVEALLRGAHTLAAFYQALAEQPEARQPEARQSDTGRPDAGRGEPREADPGQVGPGARSR
ncbi:M20/M25/M40 family metallo-hydrolase [Streptomyces sp. ISL-36]|uniref:M20/M25/M40 family metallo-hydrolase n=1 Tax=Streptomyces sp. ISL-36 TaxID=2819182 RepID=UPI001BEA89FD|nr:M20/M25/M40 family metallo-hydrolase [Streptomyces sp. ISL-36]MBT2439559.1 M20/M25/M40 family metallo-hydrolase [Streptomyces sp. ISL-36]